LGIEKPDVVRRPAAKSPRQLNYVLIVTAANDDVKANQSEDDPADEIDPIEFHFNLV
jgi:hypothetical protein